jgi:hypothetical protein
VRVKKRVNGGTEAMSCIGENTAMKLEVERGRVSVLVRSEHVLALLTRIRPPSDLNSSLTPMSDYDLPSAGSLRLKRTWGNGGVKKYDLFHL